MTELVLAVNREELIEQNVGADGIYTVDLYSLNQQNYAYLPRPFADNKSEDAIKLGAMFPQILGYFQIVNPDGRILAYQRKGKEKGLFGKWSIGIGGHVSQEDFLQLAEDQIVDYPDLAGLIHAGAVRELEEELGIETGWIECLADVDSFISAADKVISTYVDVTSSVHVGLPLAVELPEHIYDKITLDPAEFLNYQWLTPAELKMGDREWETWSHMLIK